MSDLKNDSPVQPEIAGKTATEEAAAWHRLQVEADKFADKAGETENKYDEDHGIFTK